MFVSNVNVAFDLVWSGLVAFLIMVVFDLLLLHYLEISNYLYFNYFKEKAEQVEYAKKNSELMKHHFWEEHLYILTFY